MRNLRTYQNDKPIVQKIRDWSVSSPDECDFAFRVWGGNTEIPHLHATDNVDFAKTKSKDSFLFVKANKPHVREVFDNFDTKRMFKDRVGGAQNPGGVVFSAKEVIREYIFACQDLNIEPDFVDITEDLK